MRLQRVMTRHSVSCTGFVTHSCWHSGGVPSFFLIGRDGKIIANANLQGATLNQRLAEIFGH